MKKNLCSMLLAITIFLTMIYIPVNAHQNFSFSTNFSGYEDKTGLWDGKTVVTSTVAPDSDSTVGTFASYSSMTEYNGMTSGTPVGNTRYGTSLKTVQSKQSGSSYYGGASFSFATKNRPSTSFLLETSVYIEEVTEGNIMPRIIRVKQYGGTTAYFAEFDKATNTDGGNLRVFGTTIGKYYPNRWYDIKIWFNPQTTEYKAIVLEDGKDFYSAEGTHTAFNYLTNVQRIELFHAWNCDRMATSATHNVPATQITYWDNFKIESIYRFELPDNLNTFDFEGLKDVSDMTGTDGTDSGTLGSWKIGYGGNGGVDITPVTTDKGTSIRVSVPAEADGVVNSTASSTARYPRISYDLSPKISDTAYIKGSIKFEDENIYRFSCNVTNDYSMWCILSANTIKVFGETVDTGMTFRKNTWYDFECMLDIDTGYGSVYLTDGTNTFSKTGFVPKAVEKKGTAANRFLLLHNGRMNYQEKTSFILDNLTLGSIDKMAAPVFGRYDFSSDSHKNAFVVTGGTATVKNNAFVLNGVNDNETATVAAMALPFANTDFVYSADINLEDMNADRTLSAVINGETVEIVKLGADGTLSIGDTAIENVTVSTGSYSLKLTFEQSKGKVNVSVSKDGSVIAEGSANLSDNAVNIASIDIASSAAAQAAVTLIDNISYNTIYGFEIDTKASTTGDEVVVWKDDSVTARFTNKINRSTLTKDDILVNKNSGCITELTYIDDYTVSINFPKKQGQHYHIDFIDIEDINGTVASPFIEFDVMSQDLEISKVTFFRNGEILSLSTAGNVTATFTAKANNGTSFDMIYMLGMYQSGVLVDAAWSTFTVGENMESHSLNLTVPDDGKYYVVKAYVWDNHSFKPYVEPAIITPPHR